MPGIRLLQLAGQEGTKSSIQLKAEFWKAKTNVALGETTNVLLFVAELVANSPDSQDHLWVLRVLFDFGS